MNVIKALRNKSDKRKRAARKENDIDGDENMRVSISPTMFLMGVFFIAVGRAYEFVCSLTAVILHEFAHARVAKKFGYALNEIKLMPYGAALCGNVDMTLKHEIAIAAAGPIVNLVLGLIFAAMWWIVPSSYAFTQVFCVCNMYIGIFNLLPVYPLDGGRITLALLSHRFDRKKAYFVMRILSAVFGLTAIALFVVSAIYAPNICFLTVGIFMVASAFLPDDKARYYALFAYSARRERLKRPLDIKYFAVTADATLGELCKMLDPDRFCVFRVYDAHLSKYFELDESRLIETVKIKGYAVSAGSVRG